MKNYKNSDYALNKFSTGMVYAFATDTEELTREAFFAAHPELTEQDFLFWKALSDEDYLEQVRIDDVHTRRTISTSSLDEAKDSYAQALDDQYIENQDKANACISYALVIDSGLLTETQKRRADLYFIKGLSFRKIAAIEGVHFTSVDESLQAVSKKLKTFFENL